MNKILGIIPSRYASSRFPAKALADIMGKPMIQRVYEQASRADTLDQLYVATDNQRIFDVVKNFGGNVVMTSEDHQSGTDRCAEAIKKVEGDFSFVINIQGDEPFIEPGQIDDLGNSLSEKVELATLVKKINTTQTLFDVNSTICVLDKDDYALYFSRWPIPYLRDHAQGEWVKNHTYWEQVGIYAYRTDILEKIKDLPVGDLEKAESLEQLRWMENGYKVKVGKTEFESQCIDTPEDLEKMLQMIKNREKI